MNLVNKVKTILAGMIPETPPLTDPYLKYVMYDSGWSANVRVDRNPTPAALLYLLSDWKLDVSTQTVKESANMQIFFFDVTNLDAKGEEKDLVVQRMETLAKEFIANILADKTIVIKSDKIKIESAYGRFDKFVCGVTVQLEIEERQPSCL